LAARRKSASAAMARRRASAKIWTTKSRSEIAREPAAHRRRFSELRS